MSIKKDGTNDRMMKRRNKNTKQYGYQKQNDQKDNT